MLDFEKQFYSEKVINISGSDEAGRGPLAGPLVAASVIFPKDYYHPLIRDSKKLTEKQREQLFVVIKKEAISFSIIIYDAAKIDKLNVHLANRLILEESINTLAVKPDLALIDAMNLTDLSIPSIPIIRGDDKALCIAAASILAKVTRDRIMVDLDKIYPGYGFSEHKGYYCKEHLDAINEFGPIKGVHRFSYKPIKDFK